MLTCNDRCNPYRVEPQALNVVKLGLKTLEGTTTVVAKVAACASSRVAAAAGNTICEYEVDAAGFPCRGVCCRDKRNGRQNAGDDLLERQHLVDKIHNGSRGCRLELS
jgi:hypothetical protein